MKVKHRSKPAEPWGEVGAYGQITETLDGKPRITPAYRQIPAAAHVAWGEGDQVWHTWERLADLQIIKASKKS